ncbi:MAG: efflux RND transporter permease subunit [Halohasta sp.]
MWDPERTVAWVAESTVEHAGVILAAVVVASVVLAGGLGGVSQEAGTDQFTEEVPAMDAMEEIEAEFDGDVGDSETTAQLFIQDGNVLSRPALVRTLDTQQRLEDDGTLRIGETTSHADRIATELDGDAETPAERSRAIEDASDAELSAAIAAADDEIDGQLSTDYNPTSGRASTALVTVEYDVPDSVATTRLQTLQAASADAVDDVRGNDVGDNSFLFGEGILQTEITALLSDTAIVVFPAALGLILLFLLVAYRDPVDLLLGLSALVLTLVWTFGFMGYVGIPFSDAIVSVFPLLLAVGIDFGIHTINRYREARLDEATVEEAMAGSMSQLGTAFLIVTATTVCSFAANIASPLGSLRDFGIVAAVGMTFTFLLFSVYLPAAKVIVDRLRGRLRVPSFGTTPISSEGSRLARGLATGVTIARRIPVVFLVIILLTAGVAGAYGSGVDTEFSEEAFFPSETWIDRYDRLPEPFAPSTYTFLETTDILEDEFDEPISGGVTIYIDQPIRRDDSLERIDRIGRNPPESFEESTPGEADTESVLTVIERERAADDSFDRLVTRHDRLGTGVPDRDLDVIYDELEASPRATDYDRYVSANRESARVDIAVDPDADTPTVVDDAESVAERTPLSAVATGDRVVQQQVIAATLESAIRSLVLAFGLTVVVLLGSFRLLTGRAVYGLLTLVPVLVTVGLLIASMRLLDIPLTPINAPILSISIGLGVDYAVHFVHRFVDEYEHRETFEALSATIAGTGGALTGSMVTTVTGIGVLVIALIPLIQEFGVLIALGIGYAFLASVVVTPSVIVVWERLADGSPLRFDRSR